MKHSPDPHPDLALYCRAGILPADAALAQWLRAASPPRLVLALNKCERTRGPRDGGSPGVGDALAEATRLGLGEPVAISAETGRPGMPPAPVKGQVQGSGSSVRTCHGRDNAGMLDPNWWSMKMNIEPPGAKEGDVTSVGWNVMPLV